MKHQPLKNKKLFVLGLVLGLLVLSVPGTSLADTTCNSDGTRVDDTGKEVFSVVPCPTGECVAYNSAKECVARDYTLCDAGRLIANIQELAMKVLGPIAILMVVISGLLYLTGSMKPDMLATAKKVLTYTIVGLVIVLISWIIVNTIGKAVSWTKAEEGIWSKYTINCGP